jgi:phage shock protein A
MRRLDAPVEDELTKLRESVRRLVGEWEKRKATADTAAERYAERNNEPLAQIFDKASDTYQECIRDLAAFLAENKEFETK